MEFNYGLEKKKFDAQWEKLRKEYREAGMTEYAIEEMYKFDLAAFRRRRIEALHEVPYDGYTSERGVETDEGGNPLLADFFSELSQEDIYTEQKGRFSWIETITNLQLYEKVITLSEKNKELLTLIIVDGYSKIEIAKLWGISPAAISYRIQKIKNQLST